ncbi:MAG: macro domain-containing protein [Ignavibacteriaceae bacterium]|nr:macro domain-containing protein [Ignavibacteriaceae bacterium]MCW9064969.1 macro domain-containing protein [Ignavibacteriaceae bacterium]
MSDLVMKENKLSLERGDLTSIDIESIVFYARHDLILGSGYGNAITLRGGPSIQEELKSYGTINTCDAVVTKAGNLKSKYIIHAVGPRFQEADLEAKLRTTISNTLKAADEKHISRIAFPPMGTGFYGIPLALCAKVMIDVINKHLSGTTSLKEVVICAMDNREYKAFQSVMEDKGKYYE